MAEASLGSVTKGQQLWVCRSGAVHGPRDTIYLESRHEFKVPCGYSGIMGEEHDREAHSVISIENLNFNGNAVIGCRLYSYWN